MDEPFDPYHKWLGIPRKDQPPHHYRLLGLDLFEADPDVIEHAADQRMSHVRSLVAGKHVQQSQQLLNEIAAARVCLLHPEKKAAYDAQLQTQSAPKPAEIAADTPWVAPTISATPDRPTWPQRAGPAWMRWGLGAAAATALLVLGWMFLTREPAAVPPGQPIARAPSPPPPRPSPPAPRPIAPVAEAPEPIIASPAPKTPSETPLAKAQNRIEGALGMLTDKFALCQTMPLEEFVQTVEALRSEGYRPIHARPYAGDKTTLIAAVWTRDDKPWTFSLGLTPQEVQAENERQAAEGLVPIDLAAWQAPADRHLALGLWARTGEKPENFEIYAAVPQAEQQAKYDDNRQRGFRPLRRHMFLNSDGQVHYSMVWNKHGRAFYAGTGGRAFYEQQLKPDRFQIEVGLRPQLRDGSTSTIYNGIWEITTKRHSEERHGLPPEEHLSQCRELAADGKRPVAIGVIFISDDKPWNTASVWH